MGYRRDEFVSNEWYHCYNRGVDKRKVFESVYDYTRFIEALYLCNDIKPKRSHLPGRQAHEDILRELREEPLVAIAAYCLMPNHIHILVKQLTDGGISSFMHKLGTSYTMYFNKRNDRVGNLFVKPFRSRRISNDAYFMHIANYIHLNPAELFEPGWKEGCVKSIPELEARLRQYQYSSLQEYCGVQRVESGIVNQEAMSEFRTSHFSTSEILQDAAEYYAVLQW